MLTTLYLLFSKPHVSIGGHSVQQTAKAFLKNLEMMFSVQQTYHSHYFQHLLKLSSTSSYLFILWNHLDYIYVSSSFREIFLSINLLSLFIFSFTFCQDYFLGSQDGTQTLFICISPCCYIFGRSVFQN